LREAPKVHRHTKGPKGRRGNPKEGRRRPQKGIGRQVMTQGKAIREKTLPEVVQKGFSGKERKGKKKN